MFYQKNIELFYSRDDHGFKQLRDFSTDFVLEVTAKLLNVIRSPEEPFKNVKPPQAMSARYKMGSKLAEICQELGFEGSELGYQTFLYSNEHELRSVLIFLIDKLPKDSNEEFEIEPEVLGNFSWDFFLPDFKGTRSMVPSKYSFFSNLFLRYPTNNLEIEDFKVKFVSYLKQRKACGCLLILWGS